VTNIRENLRSECLTISENALYTAQCHYKIAASAEWQKLALVIAPAWVVLLAVVASMLMPHFVSILTLSAEQAGGIKILLEVAAALSACVTAVTVTLGLDRSIASRVQAANAFTLLRHDARFLAETEGPLLSDEQLGARVAALHERYKQLVICTEPTTSRSFKQVRTEIQAGWHQPDWKKTLTATGSHQGQINMAPANNHTVSTAGQTTSYKQP